LATRRAPRVLLVDDDPAFREDLGLWLTSLYDLEQAASPDEASGLLASGAPDVVLLDLDLGRGDDGFAILEQLRSEPLGPPVIMLTGDASVSSVVRACKLGAFHYLAKPPDVNELTNLINQALVQRAQLRELGLLREQGQAERGAYVAEDPRSRALLAEIRQVAPTPATVRIQGPTGVGKEMVAREIHTRSDRPDGPFVAVNCAAIPGELIESELFGHIKGSFTGATERRQGKILAAEGGTLFLDEIGEAPAAVQAKLLRVLENRTFTPVGADRELPTDARILAATSRDLVTEVQAGRFRADLFYRLDVFSLEVPPLRDRPGDIVPLARTFLARAARECKKPVRDIAPEAAEALLHDRWDGNVRELRNVIERAVIRCQGDRLTLGDVMAGGRRWCAPGLTYDEAKDIAVLEFKRRYFATRLTESAGNVAAAARAAGIAPSALHRHLNEIGLDPDTFRPGRSAASGASADRPGTA